MKTSIILLAAVAVLSACSRQQAAQPSTPAPAEKPALSSEGYGRVLFGAKLAEVEQALASKAEPRPADPACSMIRLDKAPGVRFMVENGVITRADADAGTPNSLGIAVGDTLAQATAKHPGIEAGPHKYLPGGHYLTAKGADGRSAIVMEEDGKAITKIRAGLQPAVAYVETCG